MSSGESSTGVTVGVVILLVLSMAVSAVGFVGGAAAQSSQADVVFVFDETGSMDTQADALADEVQNVATELDAAGVDARYALITYEDREATEVDQPFTRDTSQLESALNDISTFGGTENVSHAILFAYDELQFRDGAQPIFVVISDEDDDGTTEARQKAVEELNADGATLVAVAESDNSGDNDLRNIAEQQVDDGVWTDINAESFTDIIKDIVGAIEEATGATEKVDDPKPEFEVTESSVENTSLYRGESTNVTAVVTNTGDGAGVYNAYISDSIGQTLVSERVELAPGESRRFTAEVSYSHVGSNAIMIDHDVIDRVTVERRPLEGEDLEISDASVSRSTVAPGETYTVSAVVESQANWRRDARVEFTATEEGADNSSVSVTKTVNLAPGESRAVRHRVTVPDDTSGANRTWTIGNESAGTISILSSEDAGTGPVHAYQPESTADDDGAALAIVLRNGGNETERIFVNLAPAEDALGEMRMVVVEPGEVVELRFTADELPAEAGDADTWWVNGDPMDVPA